MDDVDLIVIGGGPAGAAAAINACQLGRRVALLEAERFPRHHVGESLVQLWRIFETLGVADEMDLTFQHKHGSSRVWGRTSHPQVSRFPPSRLPGARGYSLQVERSLFDHILLRRAGETGAAVLEGHRAIDFLREGERVVGVRYRGPDGIIREVLGRYVVDASGRTALLASREGLQVVDPFYADLAVYAYFTGAASPPEEQVGNLLIEVVPSGWFWCIPLHTGEVSVGIICDRTSRAMLRRLGLHAFLRAAIQQSACVRNLLASADLTRGPFATASYGYTSTRYAGPGWFLAGDAGSFLDPMWATGVAKALGDGALAGAVVDAVLDGRMTNGDGAEHYERQVSQEIAYVDALVKFVYSCNRLNATEPFWVERGRHLPEDPGAVLRRHFYRDASTPYYVQVFRGMGADETLVARLEGVEPPAERPPRGALIPERWIPAVNPLVRLRPAVRLGRDGSLQVGLEADAAGERGFVADPLVVRALDLVDGRRTGRDIVEAAMGSPSGSAAWLDRLHIIGALATARRSGILLDADP